jgi:hypothetical protein
LQLQKEDIDFSIRYLYEWVGELVERVIEWMNKLILSTIKRKLQAMQLQIINFYLWIVAKLKYLRTILTSYIRQEFKIRLNLGNICNYSAQNNFPLVYYVKPQT